MVVTRDFAGVEEEWGVSVYRIESLNLGRWKGSGEKKMLWLKKKKKKGKEQEANFKFTAERIKIFHNIFDSGTFIIILYSFQSP